MKNFINVFNEVFNEDYTVKNCGRYKCMELIEIANKINPNMDFGDIETGMMNIENLKKLNSLIH